MLRLTGLAWAAATRFHENSHTVTQAPIASVLSQ
jgi:hypothetical protein